MKSQSLISFMGRVALAGALLLGVCTTAFAQQKISGTVLDASGQAVIGAGVVVEGTTNGVVVDLDGNWALTVPTGSNLVVSCIGYVDQKFTVQAGRDKYDVVLQESSTMLDETVVIGYGTVKVRDLTGSVSAVSSKDLEVPVASVGEALQGKMAGVVVSLNDATPGAEPQIRVRGAKSITQTNNPLYIVDGFPVSSLVNVPSDHRSSLSTSSRMRPPQPSTVPAVQPAS